MADDIVAEAVLQPPFRTRLVNILLDQVVQDPTREHATVEDAIGYIRSHRPQWTKDMGPGLMVIPELQAQVVDACGNVAVRLCYLEVHVFEVPALFGEPIRKPALTGKEMKWVGVTEHAGRELARRAVEGRALAVDKSAAWKAGQD